MPGDKKKYNVYRDDSLDYGDGHIETHREFVGETWAVSQQKAEANMAFRLGIKTFYCCDWEGDGGRMTSLEAILAEEDRERC